MYEANRIIPLFDRVLLRYESEKQTSTGIFIPKDQGDRSFMMTVVACGDVRTVKQGDKVIIAKFAGTEVSAGAEKLFLVSEYDILGVIR